MKKYLMIAFVGLAGLFVCEAEAKKDRFPGADTDKDGQLSKEEYIADQTAKRGENGNYSSWFRNRDKDGDGYLSREEYAVPGAKSKGSSAGKKSSGKKKKKAPKEEAPKLLG